MPAFFFLERCRVIGDPPDWKSKLRTSRPEPRERSPCEISATELQCCLRIISTNSPQYMPSFELNRSVTLRAEAYGFDFALSMIKLHGFGGKTLFWDHNLESFTVMAALAPLTQRIGIYATAATLTLHRPSWRAWRRPSTIFRAAASASTW